MDAKATVVIRDEGTTVLRVTWDPAAIGDEVAEALQLLLERIGASSALEPSFGLGPQAVAALADAAATWETLEGSPPAEPNEPAEPASPPPADGWDHACENEGCGRSYPTAHGLAVHRGKCKFATNRLPGRVPPRPPAKVDKTPDRTPVMPDLGPIAKVPFDPDAVRGRAAQGI